MFTIVENHNRHAHRDLIKRMYFLREEVFHNQLGWDVDSGPDGEIDIYDNNNPAYLIWCDEQRRTLYGSLRLLPTTGPTLLYDVFRSTFPNNVSLTAPGIWEGTRLCIDEAMVARDRPDIDARKAFCLMLLALCETALDHGIHTMVSNYEPPTRRLYKMAGAPLEELGRSDGFGRRPVCAGTFEVSEAVLSTMRKRLGVTERLMESSAPAQKTRSRAQPNTTPKSISSAFLNSGPGGERLGSLTAA
ncbi:MAG: acyl-homoserine-lactone synthase [Pseudomonadota bacterium]